MRQYEQKFEWDRNKDLANIEKHGFGFELARTAFEDPDLLLKYDRFLDGEDRWHALGKAAGEILIVVVHVVRHDEDNEEIIRILSARRAERDEREQYHRVHTQGW